MNDTRAQTPIRFSRLTLGLLVAGLAPALVLADTPTRPDTSAWVCELCPFSDGLQGNVAAGPGYVSEDNPDFGNFGGLEEEGAFLALETDLWYRGPDGRYLLVYGDRLGLDSRLLSIEGGQQGSYRLNLEWKETPWIRSDDARAFHIGAGTTDQRLPDGWVTGNTADMTLLLPSLRDINVGHQRETLRLGAALSRPGPWRTRVDLEHTEREGTFIKGASFLFTGNEMVAPLDDETTRVEAAVGYVRDTWQLETAYQVSLYESNNRSVRWDNPFPTFNGNERGELSLPPDNEFHQVVVSGYWRPSRSLNMAGQFAAGRATQDDTFLAPTLNPNLSVAALPAMSLDGKVDTRIANFRINGHFTDRLRGRALFRYDERDNKTPQYEVSTVVTDTFATGPFLTQPYSFTRRTLEGALDYRVNRDVSLTASVRRQDTDRDFQEVSETTTDVFSLSARANPTQRLTVRARASRESRSNDLDPALLDPFENPSLRRYHFAERDRDLFRVAADFALTSRWTTGAFVEFAEERYDDVHIGLSEASDRVIGLDLSAALARRINASAFVTLESLDAEILGADNIIGQTWRATTDDEFLTAGFSVEFGELPGRWMDARLRFTYAQANGDIEIEKRDEAPEFPELKTRRFLLEADIERELGENLSLNVGYILARAREDDFYRDNVGPDTMPNFISLGQVSPDRTVHVVRAMLRYRFR